ncbi:DUF6933 domain-containing protein [Dactylosporangium sp. NPDC048998]|uniref:DUF6933 domain-containing protein n=1 Tax=Dactylosporangium sp. NPDC048998 TaxID=3363976 RepID=UPI00371EC026
MRLRLIRDDGVVLIVRATKKLRDRIGPPDLRGDEQSTTVLGEWYATRFGWRPDVLLLVNESTLLPVLLPLAPAATALSRAADRISPRQWPPMAPRTRSSLPSSNRCERAGSALPPTAVSSGP